MIVFLKNKNIIFYNSQLGFVLATVAALLRSLRSWRADGAGAARSLRSLTALMSRQKISAEGRAGAIAVCSERQQRGLTEKLYQTRPIAYVHAPPSKDRLRRQDRFSWAALVSLVGRTLADLVRLRRAADADGKRLATLGLEAELHFNSPTDRKAFTEDLLDAVETVLKRHEQPRSARTRTFRVILGAFPEPPSAQESTRENDNDPRH